jgi:hypothetical protein
MLSHKMKEKQVMPELLSGEQCKITYPEEASP